MQTDSVPNQATTSLPDDVQKYIDGLPADSAWQQKERDACVTMQSQIDREKNTDIQEFMRDTVTHYCKDGSMSLSYVLENYWHDWIRERRALQRAVQPMELYRALESILARASDSSGYTKTVTSKRYPLVIPGNYTGRNKAYSIRLDTPPAKVLRAYYEFGVHTYFVGKAIKGILDYLEDRYGLDFKKLERARESAVKNSKITIIR